MKAEAGFCGGEVLHHAFSKYNLSLLPFIPPLSLPPSRPTHTLTHTRHLLSLVHRTKKEQQKLKRKIESAKKLRLERRHQQEANVARKRRDREVHRQQCLDGMTKTADSAEESGEDDDAEWYRQEVGEEPDPG